MARMTSALAKRWSALNCLGTATTPSVVLPLRRCCTQVVHGANDFTFLWCSFRSNVRVGVLQLRQERRHQDRVTLDVTIIHAPQVCQATIFFCNACRGSSAPGNFPGPPDWKLAVSCKLTACATCRCCNWRQQRGTTTDVSTPPPQCAWEENGTPLHALLSTQSFRSICFRRL